MTLIGKRAARGLQGHNGDCIRRRLCRSVAQPGRAPRSGRGGRRFKSCHSDQLYQWLSFPEKATPTVSPTVSPKVWNRRRRPLGIAWFHNALRPTRGVKKIEDNPMDQDVERRLRNLRGAPRCGAKTHCGAACQRPAIRGRRRCRLHGGLSPGAPHGGKNGNFRNGNWTVEAIEERRWLRSLVQTFAR